MKDIRQGIRYNGYMKMRSVSKGKTKTRVRHDLLWKELLEFFLYPALEIFHPALRAAIDPDKEPVFLNREFRVPGVRRGRRILDLLVDVPLLTGEMACVLLHLEIQGKGGDEAFPVRMHRYACLITLRMGRPFTALAIRTTPRGSDERTVYETECFETQQILRYRTVFIDALDEAELLSGNNPVGLAVVAAARMQRAGRSETRRFEYGRELMRLLKSRGYSFEVSAHLAQFVLGMINLSSQKLSDEFDKELDAIFMEVESVPVKVPMLTRYFKKKSYEWGVNEGKAEGKVEGKHEKAIETAKLMLTRGMDIEVTADLTGLSVDKVQELRDGAV
jgi:hypothetical protein